LRQDGRGSLHLAMGAAGGRTGVPTSPQRGSKSSFPGPGFVLALAAIRRLVVQIKGTEKDDLTPRRLRRGQQVWRPYQPSQRDQIVFSRSCIFTGALRNSATCDTNQGNKKRRFASPSAPRAAGLAPASATGRAMHAAATTFFNLLKNSVNYMYLYWAFIN